MLTPGNRKLGGSLIWGFGLPSGNPKICIGMTVTCHRHCYARRFESYRSSATAKYHKNLELTKLPDFAQRMRYFILNNEVRVVRIHTGGELYSVRYIRQWLRVIGWLPDVRFFTYTRSWQLPSLKVAIDTMADYPNAQLWYSCDKDTGIPSDVPAKVRLCWLMTDADDLPPQPVDLVFRIKRLRNQPLDRLQGTRICPDENGKQYARPPHCESCCHCWRPLPPVHSGERIALPLLHTNPREVSCQT